MDATYKVWRVTYSYKAAHVDGASSMGESYIIIARNRDEAQKKGDELFASDKLRRELLKKGESYSSGVALYCLRKKAMEYSEKIAIPKLSESDLENFEIVPRISKDGLTLEFIVNKK